TSSVLTLFFLIPATIAGDSACSGEDIGQRQSTEALKFKLAAVASILVAGAIGVGLPVLGRRISVFLPENNMFFMIKSFAAGVILATGFIHILPDAFATLSSPCLDPNPWQKFPFAGFIAMMAAIATLTADTAASGFYRRKHFSSKNQAVLAVKDVEEGNGDVHSGHVHVHTHASHGHAHGALPDLSRQRIISKVLELGIVVHSVIIGISLGTSQKLETIKTLMAALSFHQFFEGMGLGGCISQAKFERSTATLMMAFFSITTPAGIGIGIGISNFYRESSPRALIVEGSFNSASAGILIYMSLVDLLAADFMNPVMQDNVRLQVGAYVSLLLGSGCMAFLAKWA
ncbi:hypothetical protein M569_11603, partial [Genlisea aurea]